MEKMRYYKTKVIVAGKWQLFILNNAENVFRKRGRRVKWRREKSKEGK